LRSQRSQREAKAAGPGSLRTLSMQVQHGVGLARMNSKGARGSPADARAHASPPQRWAAQHPSQRAPRVRPPRAPLRLMRAARGAGARPWTGRERRRPRRGDRRGAEGGGGAEAGGRGCGSRAGCSGLIFSRLPCAPLSPVHGARLPWAPRASGASPAHGAQKGLGPRLALHRGNHYRLRAARSAAAPGQLPRSSACRGLGSGSGSGSGAEGCGPRPRRPRGSRRWRGRTRG
jgi:hypothetical protein